MDSTVIDGDLEVTGDVRGKNQCTAWVNFDGTTTPPTIRDSYNVSSVVRTATGQYDVYFEEDMDNINYSVSMLVSGFLFSVERSDVYARSVSKTSKLIPYTTSGIATNSNIINVQIFGGKNSWSR